MTILPTAMRIQDDIPTMLGRKLASQAKAPMAKAPKLSIERVVAILDFECKRHELSEVSVEAPAKPDADGWIPWGGGDCPIKCDANQWMYELGHLGVRAIGGGPSDSLAYSAMWAHYGIVADINHQITAYKVL